MTIADIIRAWEDPEYRKSLSEEERAKLPENPVGQIDLTEAELTEIMGGVTNTNPPNCHDHSNNHTCPPCHGGF